MNLRRRQFEGKKSKSEVFRKTLKDKTCETTAITSKPLHRPVVYFLVRKNSSRVIRGTRGTGKSRTEIVPTLVVWLDDFVLIRLDKRGGILALHTIPKRNILHRKRLFSIHSNIDQIFDTCIGAIIIEFSFLLWHTFPNGTKIIKWHTRLVGTADDALPVGFPSLELSRPPRIHDVYLSPW